ncbi:MAG TPA: glycosyltransferase family 2 protein [Thermoanaerobaculia bacterium]
MSAAAEPSPRRAVLREPELAPLRARLASAAAESLALLPSGARPLDGPARVTVVVLSRDRFAATANALRSLAEHVRLPFHLLLVDNGSAPEVRRQVAAAAGCFPSCEVLQLEQNLGCAGGRQRAVERVATEYVLFLDADAEVFPGTAELLVDQLDREPEALAAGAQVVLPDGTVQLCGGDYEEDGILLRFVPSGRGSAFGEPPWRDASACRWLAGAGALVRTAVFAEFPLDTELAYYEDNEWCYRIESASPGRLRRVPQALVLHHQESKERRGSDLAALSASLPFLEAAARIWRRHGRILDGFFGFVPELCGADGPDVAAARIWLDLLNAWGSERMLLAWCAGELRILASGARERELETARAELADVRAERDRLARELGAIHGSRLWRLADLYWSLRRAIRW